MKKTLITLTALFTFVIACGQNETQETHTFKFGSTKITMIVEDDSTETWTDTSEFDMSDHERGGSGNFSHWGGLHLGVNGLMTYDNSMDLGNTASFMELDYAKSINVGLNFDWYIPIAKNNFGLVTGFGFQWNQYALKRNNLLQFNADSIWAYDDTSRTFIRNNLKSTYLRVPLILQFNTNGENARKSFHAGIGIVGGYRLGSKVKLKYKEEGLTNKEKLRGRYNLNPFQADATLRLGYGNITLFANYGLLSFFEPGDGPQLYPFTVGISLIPW